MLIERLATKTPTRTFDGGNSLHTCSVAPNVLDNQSRAADKACCSSLRYAHVGDNFSQQQFFTKNRTDPELILYVKIMSGEASGSIKVAVCLD